MGEPEYPFFYDGLGDAKERKQPDVTAQQVPRDKDAESAVAPASQDAMAFGIKKTPCDNIGHYNDPFRGISGLLIHAKRLLHIQ